MKRKEFAENSSFSKHSTSPPSKVVAFSKPNLTTIGSLPGEVLVRIFYGLRWRDRVRGLEAVCKPWRELMRTRGWTDVRHFSYKYLRLHWFAHNNQHWISPLLDRIGPNLRSLALWEMEQINVRAELEKCPKLQHLCLQFHTMELTTLEHIHNVYAYSLKSLRLDCYKWTTAAVHTLNEALRNFFSLECLQLIERHGHGYSLCNELRLPPADLVTNLRHVSLHHLPEGVILSFSRADGVGHYQLSEKNIEILTSLTQLRSLSLPQLDPKADLTFLRRLRRLEHLCIGGIGPTNQCSFVKELSYMAGSLRALEVGTVYQRLWSAEQLISGIATNIPELEHLGLKCMAAVQWCRHLTGIEELRSLQLHDLPSRTEDVHWLGGMANLAHLQLSHAPSLEILRELINKCECLRTLRLDYYQPSPEEQASLVEAAANSQTTAPKPLLLVGVYNQTEHHTNSARNSSRLRFINQDEMSLPVLHIYKYGHMTDGKPDFTD